MTTVKKRDGRMEAFVPEKIVVSMVRSGAPAAYARTVAQDMEKAVSDPVTTQEIRTKVLAMLREKNPAWEENRAVYDAAVRKRTG